MSIVGEFPLVVYGTADEVASIRAALDHAGAPEAYLAVEVGV